MASEFADDLAFLFAASGVDHVFISTLPLIPVIVGSGTCQIIETGGTSPENTQNNVLTPAYLQPAVQLTFRHKTYVGARALARIAYFACIVRNRFVNGTWYKWIKPLQEPFDGTPEPSSGQARVQFNVIANKRP